MRRVPRPEYATVTIELMQKANLVADDVRARSYRAEIIVMLNRGLRRLPVRFERREEQEYRD